MSMNKYPMTAKGERALKDELEILARVERPAVIQSIAEARAHGDLKENAEYHAAKEKQGFIEARIRDIEGKLAGSQVIDISGIENTGKVIFSATVTLINLQDDTTLTFQIVGEDEADVPSNKLSVTSPISRACIGKEVGAVVEVVAPSGVVEYEIDLVQYL